jgi:hypothetical protein
MVTSAAIRTEINDFLAKEVALHFANIKNLIAAAGPGFQRINGRGVFLGKLCTSSSRTGGYWRNKTIAGKDTARVIAEMGLYESRQGGKAFSQLYSTLALRHYGTDLSNNAVWQSMNESERKEWHSLLDRPLLRREKRAVINLPENYLGVAARVAAMSYEMGVLKDRALLDSVVERAAEQFTSGALYSDDSPPTGRYDRYSNEYVRFCWDAANIAGRNDIKESSNRRSNIR